MNVLSPLLKGCTYRDWVRVRRGVSFVVTIGHACSQTGLSQDVGRSRRDVQTERQRAPNLFVGMRLEFCQYVRADREPLHRQKEED